MEWSFSYHYKGAKEGEVGFEAPEDASPKALFCQGWQAYIGKPTFNGRSAADVWDHYLVSGEIYHHDTGEIAIYDEDGDLAFVIRPTGGDQP